MKFWISPCATFQNPTPIMRIKLTVFAKAVYELTIVAPLTEYIFSHEKRVMQAAAISFFGMLATS